MIIRHTDEQVAAYYADPAMNQSSLKVILSEGIQSYLAKEQELVRDDYEKKHFIIGGGVDTIITMGIESFKRNYHVSSLIKKPGDGAMAVIKEVFRVVSERRRGDDIGLMSQYSEDVWNACNSIGYYANRAKPNHQEDTRMASIIKEGGEDYWYELCEAMGKQVLSDEETICIDIVSESLLTHKHTAHLFQEAEGVDVVYQFAGKFEYLGVICKFMVDEIIIRHDRKAIMPLDIKTFGDYILRFNQQIKALKYDVQGSFYTYGIKQCIKQLEKLIGRSLEDYTISNFAFVAESTKQTGTPLIFPLTNELLLQGQYGDGKYRQGWKQAIDTYIAWKKQDFKIENMFADTNGVVFVNEEYDYSIKL